MQDTKSFSSNISKSDLCTLKGTTWLCGDVLNIYLNLIKEQTMLKVFTVDTYVFTAFLMTGTKLFIQEIDQNFLIMIWYAFPYT